MNVLDVVNDYITIERKLTILHMIVNYVKLVGIKQHKTLIIIKYN